MKSHSLFELLEGLLPQVASSYQFPWAPCPSCCFEEARYQRLCGEQKQTPRLRTCCSICAWPNQLYDWGG